MKRNNRRFFLRTTALALGSVYFPSFGYKNPKTPYSNKLEKHFQVGGNTGAPQIFDQKILGIRGQSLVLMTSSKKAFQDWVRCSNSPVEPDILLFGKDWAIGDRKDIPLHIPMINSNININQMGFPKNVVSHLVMNRGGRKIGIMGISFGIQGQSIPETIHQTNTWAHFLRNSKSCEEVICLVEDPSSSVPYFGLEDLVENSKGIDQFYSTSTKNIQSLLKVITNSSGEQILLHIHSLNDHEISFLEFDSGRFLDYRSINQV